MRDVSNQVRSLGLIVVLVGGGAGGCLVPNPWLVADGEIGSETSGHADGGTEETGTSGGEQTETSGMVVGDVSTEGTSGDGDVSTCGDGVVDDGEECDDANADSGDGCLADCTVPRSCLELHAFDEGLPDGEYMIAPSYPGPAFAVECDMTTDGGGWTGLTLQHLCNGHLSWTVTAIDDADEFEFHFTECRLRTRAQGSHTYLIDIDFAPTFGAFYLQNHTICANSGPGTDSEIDTFHFIQSQWSTAHGGLHGDVSFGSPNDPGPITSYAATGSQIQCSNCQHSYQGNGDPHALSSPSAHLRIGWGEEGFSQWEGWYPWYSGSIYVR